MGKRGSPWVACALIIAAIAGCNYGATAEAPPAEAEPTRAKADHERTPEPSGRAKAEIEQEGLLIGEYRLASQPVIDGDTIRVEGIEGSIRLLSLDTEERIHSKASRAAIAKDFDQYLEKKRGGARRPRKAGTPMGEAATEFAKAFFKGTEAVRLERDDPKEIRGRFGRLLAYALVVKDGRWTSYNVECVRAGMSPYFTKYGYSHRFHNQLSHAEAEARQAKRGIWNPKAQSYRDYDERQAWWNARADFIRAFEHEANRRSDYILLSHWDAAERLEASLGKEVTVLSTIERIKHFKRLVRASLAMKRSEMFPIIFFDKEVFERSGIARYEREPVSVRGRVERYERGTYSTLQIVVDDPAQIVLPKLPPAN
jgi:endonuclease YncB( thermonuclease family)